jgi:ribosomal protein L28
MSRSCQLCLKQAVRANHRSHSKQLVPRRQHPNLQFLQIGDARLKVCSGCRRTLAKAKQAN